MIQTFSRWVESWLILLNCHDSKVHGANMGPIGGRQDPGGPHVGPLNLAIWVINKEPPDIFLRLQLHRK